MNLSLLLFASLFSFPGLHFEDSPQNLPFSQNWSGVSLFIENNWSSVPGIVGYKGQGITNATGADPQTLLTTSPLMM